VAVRLNNKWKAKLPPLTGDHTFQGGLYRNVFLVVRDPLHIAWYGTSVTTHELGLLFWSENAFRGRFGGAGGSFAAPCSTLVVDSHPRKLPHRCIGL